MPDPTTRSSCYIFLWQLVHPLHRENSRTCTPRQSLRTRAGHPAGTCPTPHDPRSLLGYLLSHTQKHPRRRRQDKPFLCQLRQRRAQPWHVPVHEPRGSISFQFLTGSTSESLGTPMGTRFPALRYGSRREQGALADGSKALRHTSGTEEHAQPAQTDRRTTSICNGLREPQRREENNTAEASPQSPARVKWGSWFLAPAKRSLNACSGAARRVSRDRLHKRSPRLELAAAERGTAPALLPCQEEPSRGPGWPGGEGRGAGTNGCVSKNPLCADSLLGRVSHKRKPAF